MTLTSLSRTADVTVQPAAAATVTIGLVTLNLVRHLRFTGNGGSMKIGGTTVDPSDNRPRCSSNLTFDHITYTAGVNVITRCGEMNILLDHDTFDNLGTNTWEGRLNVVALNANVTRAVGVTISNSHFAGGCSDGIDVIGAPGVQVGTGNEFTNIQQGPCGTSVHADPIQCGFAPHLLVTGNYFHDNGDGSGGFMCGNGERDITITNNVFACTCIYPWSVFGGGAQNWKITHNTFAGGGSVRFEVQSVTPSGNLVRDNVFTARGGISLDSGSSNYGSNDHNLNPGQPGTANMRGTPVFVAGKKPTSYAGYRLMAGSRGRGAASDGSDMGIRADR